MRQWDAGKKQGGTLHGGFLDFLLTRFELFAFCFMLKPRGTSGGCVEHFPVLCYNYFIYYTDSVPIPGRMMRIPDAVFHFEAALKGKMYAYT